jgi:hypothetical protein
MSNASSHVHDNNCNHAAAPVSASVVTDFKAPPHQQVVLSTDAQKPLLTIRGTDGVKLYEIQRDGTLVTNPDVPDAEAAAASIFFAKLGNYMHQHVIEEAQQHVVPYILIARRIKRLGVIKTRADRDLLNGMAQFPDGSEKTQLPQLPISTLIGDYAVLGQISSIERLVSEGLRVSAGMRDGYPRALMHMLTVALGEYATAGENDTVKSMLETLSMTNIEIPQTEQPAPAAGAEAAPL